MNKNELNRLGTWRLKLLRQADEMPRGVAQTCRHYGLSRKTFYIYGLLPKCKIWSWGSCRTNAYIYSASSAAAACPDGKAARARLYKWSAYRGPYKKQVPCASVRPVYVHQDQYLRNR